MAIPPNSSGHRFYRYLKINRISSTSQRLRLFDYMLNHPHQTAQQIVLGLNGQVSKATVYRNLDLFERRGAISRHGQSGITPTDYFSQHTHTFTCRVCGKRTALWNERIERDIQSLATKYPHVIEDHALELSGLCSNCAPANRARPRIGINIRRSPLGLR